MTDPQLPLLDDVMSRGVQALIAARPTTLPHTMGGEYGKIIQGWRAQLALVLDYISKEIRASRLPLAEGQELLQLLASEYLATVTPTAQAAIGAVMLRRVQVDTNPSSVKRFTPGVVKQGSRFTKRADPNASPAVTAADYESVEPVYCGADATSTTGPVSGNYTHVQLVPVSIQCSRTGEDGNAVAFFNGPAVVPIALNDTLFDASISTTGYTKFATSAGDAAGGVSGQSDAELRSLAKALSLGQFAPTGLAAVAGALSENGVVHTVTQKDLVLAVQSVYVADRSWASSAALVSRVSQRIHDSWQGFGCRISVTGTQNVLVAVNATVLLTDVKFAADTFEIRESIRTALRSYFDNRPDYYMWKSQAVRAVVAHSDPRILTCTAATVVDGYSGDALAEPAPTSRFHYFIADSGVSLTFSTPA